MLVKQVKDKYIFSFHENKLNLEFATMIINQLSLPSILLGKNCSIRGRDGYEIDTKKLILLDSCIKSLSDKEIIKIVYDILFAIKKTEETRIINKYCLCCNYEYLFYNEEEEIVKYIALPVSVDQDYGDGLGFEERLKHTLFRIIENISDDIKNNIQLIVEKYLSDEDFAVNDALIELGNYMNSDSRHITKGDQKRQLSLIYFDEEAMEEKAMEKEEILLGKEKEKVDVCFEKSKAISRIHCKIIKQNNNFFVQDLDSLNHTLVNGEFVPPYELMELNDMDLITVGDIEVRVNIK